MSGSEVTHSGSNLTAGRQCWHFSLIHLYWCICDKPTSAHLGAVSYPRYCPICKRYPSTIVRVTLTTRQVQYIYIGLYRNFQKIRVLIPKCFNAVYLDVFSRQPFFISALYCETQRRVEFWVIVHNKLECVITEAVVAYFKVLSHNCPKGLKK